MLSEYEKDNPAFECELEWAKVGPFVEHRVSAGVNDRPESTTLGAKGPMAGARGRP